MDKSYTVTIRELYPHLNQKELAEAEENLEKYLALVLRIFEHSEPKTNSARCQLTPNPGAVPCSLQEASG